QGTVQLVEGQIDGTSTTLRNKIGQCLSVHAYPLAADILQIGDTLPLGEEYGIAETLPPQNPHAQLGQDSFIDHAPDLAAGRCGSAHKGREIEQERLIEDGYRRNPAHEVVGRRNADFNGARRYGADHLRGTEKLGLVENLD